jgi:hypothetical protein
MKHIAWLAGWAAVAASGDALAVGSLASVNVIDRQTGAALAVHYYQGEYWVAGSPGARYAIQVRNCDGGRLLAVTSVDGVNVLSGRTAGWSQSGYVFDPGESYQIAGWRKSHTEVAAFTFTDSPNSYAQRTGRPDNVGVIGVALFREHPQEISTAAPLVSPAPAASAGAHSSAQQSRLAAAAAPKLGTGHGEREASYVVDTTFRRMQDEPNEVIRIRYDSLEHLMALGIIPAPAPGPGGPNPFPGSRDGHFVPDPPG